METTNSILIRGMGYALLRTLPFGKGLSGDIKINTDPWDGPQIRGMGLFFYFTSCIHFLNTGIKRIMSKEINKDPTPIFRNMELK